ncbi:hypothetical protein [Yeosuana marina]|uniref:hypothetical protein n=1 Tax=Yeosuana marina TaxID=1565536 RepID=UPI0030C821C5
MKNRIVLMVSLVFYITASNAQIKKPAISEPVSKIKSDQLIQGLKITKMPKISLNDLNKLDIPIIKVAKEKLDTKPTMAWSINPMKHHDGNLKLMLLYGIWSQETWEIGSGEVSESLRISILNKKEDFRSRSYEYNHGQWRFIFPEILTFKALGGVEYLLRITFQGDYIRGSDAIYIGRESYISEVSLNEYKEANYLFRQENSGEINIYISPILFKLRENVDGFLTSNIREIKISRLD